MAAAAIKAWRVMKSKKIVINNIEAAAAWRNQRGENGVESEA